MAQPQFTPNQILEAARRAQAEGQHDYAHQAYRYLVDNYPGTAEAVAAHDALAQRQSHNQPPAEMPGPATGPATSAPVSAMDGASVSQSRRPTLVTPQNQPKLANGPGYSPANGAAAAGARRRPHRQRQLQLEPVVGPETGEQSFTIPAPPPRKHQLANSLASLAVVIGTLIVAAGGVTVLLSIVAPDTLAGMLRISPGIGILIGSIFVVHGLLIVLGGMVARVVFSNAKALHYLAAGDGPRGYRRGMP